MKSKTFFSVLTVLAAVCLGAGEDIPVNGEFKGASGNNIPGWSLRSGVVRAVTYGDDNAVELQNDAELVSAKYPVTGSQLELKAEVRGSGIGKVSYIIFDRSGNQLKHHADGIRFSAQRRKSKVRAMLNVPQEAAALSIVLSAAKGSTVIFEDVEAEFYRPRPVIPGTHGTVPLVDERRYKLNDLENVTYSATLSPGRDIEFKLEESETAKWQIKSSGNRFCRVEMEHDRDGVWPFRRYDAEVEIKALRKGKCEVVLHHASGKEMKIAILVD